MPLKVAKWLSTLCLVEIFFSTKFAFKFLFLHEQLQCDFSFILLEKMIFYKSHIWDLQFHDFIAYRRRRTCRTVYLESPESPRKALYWQSTILSLIYQLDQVQDSKLLIESSLILASSFSTVCCSNLTDFGTLFLSLELELSVFFWWQFNFWKKLYPLMLPPWWD